MKKYWEATHGQTGIIFLFIICLILIGISLFYNWLYAVSIPLSLFFIYNLFQDYSQTMERVRGNEKYNELEPVRHQMNLFINEMNKMPDWYKIIQARGNGHAMFEKDMGIKVDDYEYWANAHKDEYIMKYNERNLDVEGVKLRIKKFGYIASELEKVIKIADELKLNTTPEIFNDYCAARASVLGAEYALKEMSSN